MDENLDNNTASIHGQSYEIAASLTEVEPIRQKFTEFLENASVYGEETTFWKLAFTEAIVNAIKHGCNLDDKLHVTIAWMTIGQGIRLEVSDPGVGPPDSKIESPDLPQDPFTSHGRGLYLIREFADSWQHWQGPDGYRLVIFKKHPQLTTSDELEKVLENAIQDLSASYENLSAFYRLGDGLVRAESIEGFVTQAAKDLSVAVPNTAVWFTFNADVHAILEGNLFEESVILPQDHSGKTQNNVLSQGAEFIWETRNEVNDDSTLKDYQCGACCPVKAGGEVQGVLTVVRESHRAFNTGELNTLRTFSDIVGIAVLNAANTKARSEEARAFRELEIASEIQKTLLPLPALEEDARWEIVTRRSNAREVAGDYVDVKQGRNGELYLVIVDVMGKGVSAAFLAAMFRTALHISLTFQYSLPGLMAALNRTLSDQLGKLTMFATCAIVRITPNLDRFEVVNAGHCPVILYDPEGEMVLSKASGPPLGLFRDAEYTSETFTTKTLQSILLVTDGLFEWGHGGKVWGWNSLCKFVETNIKLRGDALWDKIQKEIDEKSDANDSFTDDRTLICWSMNTPSQKK